MNREDALFYVVLLTVIALWAVDTVMGLNLFASLPGGMR